VYMMLRKMLNVKILVFCSLIIALVAASFGCSETDGTNEDGGNQLPVPGREAPDFTLVGLDGETVSLRDFRGSPVFLNFWATWCGPCRFEMPFIQEVYEDPDWQATGLVILSVNIGESGSEVQEFLDNEGLGFAVLLDSSSTVAQKYNIRYIPTTFSIDENGIIDHIDTGAFPGTRELEGRLLNLISGDE